MEQINNKITEVKFTQNDILKGMLLLDDKKRNAMSAISVDHLTALLNDEEELNKFYEYCNNYVIAYHDMQKSVERLAEILHRQKESGSDVAIVDVVEQFKCLSEDGRLEFFKAITNATDVENPLDLLNYSWNRLVYTLRGIKNEQNICSILPCIENV